MTSNNASDFLDEVKRISHSVCGDRIVSIRQFGSVVDGYYKPRISDIDFIVLVTDDCPSELMNHLREELVRLESAHNVASVREVGALQRNISSYTALFKSHFVFHRSTLEKHPDKQLFEEAEALDLPGGSIVQWSIRFLFPWRLVLANVVSQSKLVLGTDELGDFRTQVPWRTESAKAFLLAYALALLGLVDSLLSVDGTRISLEATKWYLIDKCSAFRKKRTSLVDSLRFFRSPGTNIFFDRFEKLRTHYSSDRFFSLSCPLYLGYLQLSGKKNQKWV